ncbi:MAG: phosphotriesterase [Bacteroidia bacterium]|nr:MAG: phosphotriesterase [Bacteroidia bacterium]
MKNGLHIGFFLAIGLLLGCQQKTTEYIMTVRGPIPASEMGITLSHEHILVDFIGADSTGYHRWNKEEVAHKVLPFLTEIQEYEVSTLVECTPAYLGRDPWLLMALAEQTGMHLVTNTGYYGAHNNLFVPAQFHQMSAEEVSKIWVEEFENGIEGSGVRPGFIKIAVDGDSILSEAHLKIITAAALTHQQTGMVIASHTGPDAPAFAQISVLQSHGIDPSCFIWVHAQSGTLEGNIKAAQLGTWISLDNINLNLEPGSAYDVEWYATRIAAMKEAGFLHRVLISHDAGWYKPEEEDGGEFRGFTGIFTGLVPALLSHEFSKEEIDLLLVENPRKAFSLRLPV